MEMDKRVTARRLVETLLAHGRHSFTRAEAEAALAVAPRAAYMALHRLVQRGWLGMPHAGFYIIVEPQYRAMGSLPPEWFIDGLMKKLGTPYYVGLLSAAQMDGAAHQSPQEFQVVIPGRSIRPVRSGRVYIRFFRNGRFAEADTREVKTPTGMIRVSSPETTAWDLVRYAKASGGLGNVVTVLSELSARLDQSRLRVTVRKHRDVLVAQRLGYILDRVARRGLTKGVASWVATQSPSLGRLDPSASAEGAPVSRKWRLLINAQVEAEA